MESILDRIGRANFTLYTVTETVDGLGRISNVTESSSTISGFLELVTPQDKQYLDTGVANIGDGIFYAAWDTSIVENDEMAESGSSFRWKFTKKVEGQEVGGDILFQAWVVTKKV